MRKGALLYLTLLALPATAHGAVDEGHSGWKWGNPQPQANSLSAVTFAGGTGYAAGDFGTLLKTTNSGVDWSGLATGSTANLTQVRALDDNTVIAAAGCVVRRSDDGGRTFRPIPAAATERRCSATVRAFSFVSPQVGYLLMSNGAVFRTNDGGVTFGSRAALPGTAALGDSPAAVPTDIWFVSSDTGLALAGGTVYRTTDAGTTW